MYKRQQYEYINEELKDLFALADIVISRAGANSICELLALHAGQTFSKEQIYEAVFGYDGTADDTAITQHIKNIRAKLRVAGAGEVLQTIWGVGYQWKNES